MKDYCHVVISNKSRNTDKIYTYRIPKSYREQSLEGRRCVINFNNNLDIGMIVAIVDTVDYDESKLKGLIAVIDEKPIISKTNIEVALWIRNHYLSRYNEAFSLFMHPFSDIEIMIKSVQNEIEGALEIGWLNTWKKYHILAKSFKDRGFSNSVEALIETGQITIRAKDLAFEPKITNWLKIKNVKYEDQLRANSHKQLRILKYIDHHISVRMEDLVATTLCSKKEVNTLIEKGYIDLEKIDTISPKPLRADIISTVILTDEQRIITEKLLNSSQGQYLIHGVTGSGKTEVYMRVIEKQLALKKSVIFLVPEISLTPQTIERFKQRFGDRIAVIHSRLTIKERNKEWLNIYHGHSDIVIGARSALFTPVRNLGAIIIDESHEDSYISSTSPKYDTIEVSEKISSLLGAKLILGTATPPSSYYLKAMNNVYTLLNLTKRVNDIQMPDIEIVDMRNELTEGNNHIFSRILQQALISTYEKNEQAILFLNRRGYSSFVSCRQCGFVVKCDNCDISMTYHQKSGYMVCHYCGATKKIQSECPECGSKYFKSFGVGTEKIEEETIKLLPNARIERMDFDTTKGKEGFNKIYENFKSRKTDVLVGTQMLAKGLHFPGVTLVGIVSADLTINLPFYTSNEKSYQLITQVSGRAGRGDIKGRVIVQTYEPNNYSIVCAKNNDYLSFVKRELILRKEFKYPPFVDIVAITASSKNEDVLRILVQEKYHLLKNAMKTYIDSKKMILYPPMNHNIYKINNKYRISIIMKHKKSVSLEIKTILRELFFTSSYKEVDISIDINPISI
ncbi:MAG: primosomal protein N' [Tissierellales bacterium]|nr:primosomal protein N' [Tissierellales bacterium]MBN2827689.1 primosomal protein N' [Tissierellales bacterium]